MNTFLFNSEDCPRIGVAALLTRDQAADLDPPRTHRRGRGSIKRFSNAADLMLCVLCCDCEYTTGWQLWLNCKTEPPEDDWLEAECEVWDIDIRLALAFDAVCPGAFAVMPAMHAIAKEVLVAYDALCGSDSKEEILAAREVYDALLAKHSWRNTQPNLFSTIAEAD